VCLSVFSRSGRWPKRRESSRKIRPCPPLAPCTDFEASLKPHEAGGE
jgi:hypothetical protein